MQALPTPWTAASPALRRAFCAYQAGHATLGQAAGIAQVPMVVFLDEARRAGVLPCWRPPGKECREEALGP